MVPLPLDAGSRSAATDPTNFLAAPEPVRAPEAASFEDHLRRTDRNDLGSRGDEEDRDEPPDSAPDAAGVYVTQPPAERTTDPQTPEASDDDSAAVETPETTADATDQSKSADEDGQARPAPTVTPIRPTAPRSHIKPAPTSSDTGPLQADTGQPATPVDDAPTGSPITVQPVGELTPAVEEGSTTATAARLSENAVPLAEERQPVSVVLQPATVVTGSEGAAPVDEGPPDAKGGKRMRAKRGETPAEEPHGKLDSPADHAEKPAESTTVATATAPTHEEELERKGRRRDGQGPLPAAPTPADAPSPADAQRANDNAVTGGSPRLAQHLLARGEERESRAGGLTSAEQGRMLDRVARAFRAAESRQGVVKLRLHPPELGTLRIELRVEHGTLTARLEAETSTAQSLLLEHAQQLRDRLAEQGVRVDRFDVDLLNQRSPHDAGSFDQRPSSDGSAARPAPRAPASNAPAVTETRGAAPLVPAPGQLNIIV